MRTGKRRIRRGIEYEPFFKPATGENITVLKEARLEDTLKWIKKVIEDTLDQSEAIAQHLEGANVRETCRKIWEFCFYHFQYEKDEERKEQIRTPSRAWQDRGNDKGIDCDCFSTLIGSILTNLNIPFVMRLARYKGVDFEHIYPVAFDEDGKEIIIDCVVYQFDYEVAIPPQGQLKDVEMELQILNGVDNGFYDNDLPIDAEDLFLNQDYELEGIDGIFKKFKEKRAAKKAIPKEERKEQRQENRKEAIAKFKSGSLKDKIRTGFNVLNKANPGAMLLRGGILASMKLNLFKVASRLRFAYWTPEQARANDMDLAKYEQLQKIRQKLEQIYFRAGGKPTSLREAMLTGKGNKNKQVALNGLRGFIESVSDHDDLRTILGEDLYYNDLNGFEGINGLGEPASIATGAAVTAATGAMGIIAGLLKKVGGLFKKGSRAAEQFEIQDNSDNAEEQTRKFSLKNLASKVRDKVQQRRAAKGGTENEIITIDDEEFNVPEAEFEPIPEDEYLPTTADGGEAALYDDTTQDGKPNSPDASGKGGLVQWVKDNKGLAIGIGAGSLAAIAVTIFVIRAYRKSTLKKKAPNNGVNGVSKAKKTKKKKTTTTRRKPTTTKRPTTRKPRARAKKPTQKLREIVLR